MSDFPYGTAEIAGFPPGSQTVSVVLFSPEWPVLLLEEIPVQHTEKYPG
jgi:hypothetical protein